MPTSLQDYVVIITGGSSGLGAATARKLIPLGARVMLAARREDQLRSLTAELGPNARYIVTDVASQPAVEHLVRETLRVFGRVDALWNNAGVMALAPFEQGNVADWERQIDINLKGVLYGIHAVLPHLLAQGSGHILATSSIGGLKTMPTSGVYSATKWAVRVLMETLREELAGKIKVTTLYPGSTATELRHAPGGAGLAAAPAGFHDVQQLAAADVAEAVVYALSQPPGVAVNEITVRPLTQKL